jgi:hypothetical protein
MSHSKADYSEEWVLVTRSEDDKAGDVVQAANDSAFPKEPTMDIAGAKALKERLGPSGADDAPSAGEPADVPADAPPVYHWTGKTPLDAPAADVEEPAGKDNTALFRRLSLSFR